MVNSTILDVAIGLILIYLVLSLICTAVNESIEAVLRYRAVNLERGLREMLQDPDGSYGIVAALYNHPLIDGLFYGDYDYRKVSPGAGGSLENGGVIDSVLRKPQLPAYIPSRSFSMAMVDLIRLGSAVGPGESTTTSLATTVEDLHKSLLANSLIQASPDLKRSLEVLIVSAGNDMAHVRANLETWYNASMDRISGWYKRRCQFLSLAVGLALAIFANADTFALTQALSQNKALGESLVQGAKDYEALSQASHNEGRPVLTTERWLATRVDEFAPLGLPIGWKVDDAASPAYWTARFPGWFITTLAISLGSPFWFDLLNRFMIIRSTVKPHEKSPEESSRD